MEQQQLQDIAKALELTLSILKGAPGLKGTTTPRMPKGTAVAQPKIGVGSVVKVHGKEMRVAGIKDPTAKNWMKKYEFEGMGTEQKKPDAQPKEKQDEKTTEPKQKPAAGPTLAAAPKQYQTSVKNTLKEKLANTLGLIQQYKRPTLVPETQAPTKPVEAQAEKPMAPQEVEQPAAAEPDPTEATAESPSSVSSLETQLKQVDESKLSETDKMLLRSNLKVMESLNKVMGRLSDKERGLVQAILKEVGTKEYNADKVYQQAEAAHLDPQSIVQAKQAELEQIENRLGVTSNDKEYSQLKKQKMRIEGQIKMQAQRVDKYEVSKLQAKAQELGKQREHCYKTKGHSNPVCGVFNEQIKQVTSEIEERKASSAVDFSDPKLAKVAISKINDRATLQIVLDKSVVEKVPSSVTKAITKRMDELAEADTAQMRRTQEKQYAAQFDEIDKNPGGFFKVEDKAPELKASQQWEDTKGEVFAAFPLMMLNKERQGAGQSTFKTLKDYHAEVGKEVDSYLNNNNLKGIKMEVKPEAGTITMSAADWDKNKKLFRTGKDTNYTLQTNASKGITTLSFSSIGGLKVMDTPKSSMVEAALKIDALAKANPTGAPFKVMGASEDGSPSIQTMDGKKGVNAEMVYAGKGSGKTEKLEGGVMANLMGNTKGNYKCTIVDPKGAAFNWLVKEDGSLRDIKDISPKYQSIAPHLIEAIKDGRMKVYSVNVKAMMTQEPEKAKQWLTTMVQDLSQTEAIRSKFAGDDFMSRPYKMGIQDVHVDEMNELVDNLKTSDPLLYNEFVNTISTIVKGASRKGGMPLTMYAQSPVKDAKFKAATGALDAVSSLGGTDNQAVRYAHPAFKFKGVEATLGQAGNGRSVSLTPDGIRTYSTLAVGPVVKDELGKLPAKTSAPAAPATPATPATPAATPPKKSFKETDMLKSRLQELLSVF